MKELIHLQTSQQVYCSHETRTFNRVEETLAYELAVTHLNTAIIQLEKKEEQIVKLDKQIIELLQDAIELETRGVTRHNTGENE